MLHGLSHWYWTVTLDLQVSDTCPEDMYQGPVCLELKKTELRRSRYSCFKKGKIGCADFKGCNKFQTTIVPYSIL